VAVAVAVGAAAVAVAVAAGQEYLGDGGLAQAAPGNQQGKRGRK
jgi:hypothetical protein